jgi:hypothetical protein
VQNEQGKPLPWAVVSIDALEYGAMADSSGAFSMYIPRGSHLLQTRCLGHPSFAFNFRAKKDTFIEIILQREDLTLDDVVIVPGERDPAYGIIKAAIRRKKANRRPFDQYQCEAYTKVAFGLPRDMTPARLMFELAEDTASLNAGMGENPQEMGQEFGDPMITAILSSPIFFMSENISTFYYEVI